MSQWDSIAKSYWDAQPSPHAPGLTNGEVVPAVLLATKAKAGGHASMAEATLFHKEFQNLGMTPQDFTHAFDRLAPLSFTYHGRPPSMQEVKDLAAAHPGDVRSYYADLPDTHYPHVSAGQMVGALQAADPHAREFLGRPPVKLEAAYLVHSKEPAAAYYSRLAGTTANGRIDIGASASTGPDTGSGGKAAPR